ncbi:MAG: serine hydrolase [Sphingomonadaceae bacterium]|nr:serine hydrolase [Sphingomonadaceae bacterium]
MARRALLALLLLLGLCGPALAQPQEPSAILRGRAEQVVALLRGQGDPADLFTPEFLAQVPPAQVRAIGQQIVGQYGAVRGLDRLEAGSPQSGLMHVGLERAVLTIQIAVQPQPPNRISGLLITGAEMRSDSFAAIVDEIRALPGEKSVAIARLGQAAPELLASLEPARPLAIGSAFKLFILAELSRQVAAGQRHWTDLVALDRHSIPSGTLQTWPLGAPLTLHTLASLMISVSDNTAADMLLHVAGRENVERMMATIGIADPARNRPFLSTLEMSAIKTGPTAAFDAWQRADEAGRRRLLARDYAAVDASRIDVARFTGNPLHIELEWYASAADMVRTMDWLRRNGDDTARAILAINPGLGPQLRGELAYVGYKGGSEPGVLNLTWLVRNNAGAWYAITGSWNNAAAPVEEQRFVGLLARAVRLVRN